MSIKDIVTDIVRDPRFPEGGAWRRVCFEPGMHIVKKGDEGRTLFLIETGVVRVLGDTDVDGGKKISPGLCDLEAGDVFGDLCLFGWHQRTASVAAVSAVSLIELDGERLGVYFDDHPVQGYLFLKALFEIISNRLRMANDRIEHLLAWGLKVHEIDKFL